MTHARLLAGGFAGAGALLLIHNGHITEGAIILSSMVGFFIGENNEKRKTKK